MEILFFIAGLLCVFSYFVYPVVLKFMPARALQFKSKNDDTILKLTLIITAHNEEQRIKDKLLNTLEIDYPADSLEVVIASDCSTDGTDAIVESYSEKGK